MKTKISQISELKKYMREMLVTGRPGDAYPRIQHAPKLNAEIIQQIAGSMCMYADDNSIEIGTRTTRSGIVHEVNQIWFKANGRPYWIGAHNQQIEIRDRDKHGNAVHRIDRTTSPTQVAAIFAALYRLGEVPVRDEPHQSVFVELPAE